MKRNIIIITMLTLSLSFSSCRKEEIINNYYTTSVESSTQKSESEVIVSNGFLWDTYIQPQSEYHKGEVEYALIIEFEPTEITTPNIPKFIGEWEIFQYNTGTNRARKFKLSNESFKWYFDKNSMRLRGEYVFRGYKENTSIIKPRAKIKGTIWYRETKWELNTFPTNNAKSEEQ